mmetsp:Transcript_18153/g.70164  ORF Transcript_18153/g.70164 Transcript_18153/m.70164 type:complete len:399 (+) Transcript_18153:136-1332(+)
MDPAYRSAPEDIEARTIRRAQRQAQALFVQPMPPLEAVERALTKVSEYWELQESESESEATQSAADSDSSCESRGYESAGNKSTPNKTPSKRRSRACRDSLASRVRKGKPGSRRHQRWLNEARLGRRAHESFDLGADQEQYIDEFFEDYAETPLSLMVEFPELRRAWQPFVNVTEEQELAMLRQLEGADDLLYSSDEEKPSRRKGGRKSAFSPVLDPSRAFATIPRETRQLLRKYHESPLLSDVDLVLSKFARCSLAPPAALERGYEFFSASFVHAMPDYAEAYSGAVPGYLVLAVEDSLHRRLVHGICSYYSMFSTTYRSEAGKVMVIGRPKAHEYPTQPFLSYLTQTQADVEYWAQPPRSRPRRKRKPADSCGRSDRMAHEATFSTPGEYQGWVLV